MSDNIFNETFSKPRERVEESAEGFLRLASPAKINLNLLVGPVRKDGYHPLDSYVAKVTLYDQITLRRREDSEINLNIGGVYFGGKIRNTAYIAAKIMAERYEGHGVDIDLFKVVPSSTGLGSPSSNAATVLWGLNKIWALGLSNDEIIEIGILLGSDVAMFLGPPASRMTGRGAVIEPVDVLPF